MPSSHWGNRVAAWLIVSISLLAIFWTGWWTIELHTEQRVSEYYEGKYETQKANDEVLNECLARSAVERVQCIREAVAAEEKRDYEARDLHAQERMAHWAFLMFIAGLVGTITAAVGTVLLYGAWKAARETVEVALADQRPWLKLTVEVIEQVTFDGKDVRVAVKWTVKNIGRSPATYVNVEVSAAPFVHSFVARQRARHFVENFASLGLSSESLTLFPEDRESRVHIVPIDPNNADEVMRELPEREYYMPEICVFVGYRMAGRPNVMVTNVSLNLHRRSASGLGFNIKELPIPADGFVLRRSLHTEHAT